MTAQTTTIRELSEPRSGTSVKRKRMSRPRNRISCGQGRDFFKLAASYANADQRESDFGEEAKKTPKDAQIELAMSKLLQAHYQERSAYFVAQPAPRHHDTLIFVGTVLEKWQRAGGAHGPSVDAFFHAVSCDDGPVSKLLKDGVIKNGVQFSARESTHLIRVAEHLLVREFLSRRENTAPPLLSAMNLHRALRKSMNFASPRPFVVVASTQNGDVKKILVEHARLFWSHRLKTKALQASNSAEPSICYFHAALRGEGTHGGGFDFLYWLKLDEEKVALDGDFIRIKGENLHATNLFFPEVLLVDAEAKNTCLAMMDSPTRLFVEEVSRLFAQ